MDEELHVGRLVRVGSEKLCAEAEARWKPGRQGRRHAICNNVWCRGGVRHGARSVRYADI
jgi:hypothetical protein